MGSGAMNVHPAWRGFAVRLHRAEEFPAVALVEPGVIGQQIEGVDSLLMRSGT